MSKNSMIYVKVPATSANMGCGFDCFGIALDLYNTIGAMETGEGIAIKAAGGKTVRSFSENRHNLVYRAMDEVFSKAEYRPKGLLIVHKDSAIPRTRGLGSSAACIAAGVLLANELAGQPFSRGELLNIACRMEGHSDNATAALCGGFNVSLPAGGTVFHRRAEVGDDIVFLLMIPKFTLSTQKSRKSLPQTVRMRDAVNNIARASMMAMAFAAGDYSSLPLCFGDALHEKYRKGAIPGAESVLKAAGKFGAYGAYLSGSGPTVAAIVSKEKAAKFQFFMSNFLLQNKLDWEITTAQADNQGAVVIRSK